MATNRRMLLDIDRTLKKITEGLESFDITWDRMHESRLKAHESQFKRYSHDLRKELKRLRRLREQVRNWISSDDIKDKTFLNDTRRLIESRMERYERYEKVAKRKMFSTDGLNNYESLSPVMKERSDISDWLVLSIDALGLQLDQFECEVESLSLLGKKKPAKSCANKLADLKSFEEKHTYHIKKLETLLRMFNNMSVTIAQIQGIKDYVDYYIESSQEPEFQEIVNIYDDIPELEDSALCGVDILFPPKSDDGSSKSSNDLNTELPSSKMNEEGDHGKGHPEPKESKVDMAMGDCNGRRDKTLKNEKATSKNSNKTPVDCTSPPISPRFVFKKSKFGPDISSHGGKTAVKNSSHPPTTSASQPVASINVWKIEKPPVTTDLGSNVKRCRSTDDLANSQPSDKLSQNSSPINPSDFPCIGQCVSGKTATKTVVSPTNKTWSSVLCKSTTQCPANATVHRPLEVTEEAAPSQPTPQKVPVRDPATPKKSREKSTPKPDIDPKDRRMLVLEWFYKDYYRGNHLKLNPIEEEIFFQNKLRSQAVGNKCDFNIFDKSNNMDNAVLVDRVFKNYHTQPNSTDFMQYYAENKFESLHNSLKDIDISYFEMRATPSLLAEQVWHFNPDTRPLTDTQHKHLAYLEAAAKHKPEVVDSIPVTPCDVATLCHGKYLIRV